LYASDLITLRGGQDARHLERKRLKPGDRLADGTIWTGNSKLDGLKKVSENLQLKIAQLQEQFQKVLEQIQELESVVVDDGEINPPVSPRKPKKTAKVSEPESELGDAA